MEKKDIESILLMNKFLTVNRSNDDCCYFMKRILDSKINSIIDRKPNSNFFVWFLGFIFVDRLGL